MNVLSATAAIRTLNELDHVRIGKLVDAGSAAHAAMQSLLDNADLLAPDEMPADVVTMRSRVRVSDAGGVDPREITLSYPAEADAAHGQVSVLSPVGTALLGLKAGETASWTMLDGRSATLHIDAIVFQPEAAGDYLR